MSIDDLLKPRYKVIADYPGSQFAIGMVCNKYYAEWVFPNGIVTVVAVEYYPHLFSKLEWHEERLESDMPKYMKLVNDTYPAIRVGTVVKVVEWHKGRFRFKKGEYETLHRLEDGWQFATEAEYKTLNKK